MIFKDNKILLSRRLSERGQGEYQFPGGHLEYNESIYECASRETMEEAGIEIDTIRFLCISNIAKYKPKHYINIGVVANWKSGTPQNLEPEKTGEWEWYNLDALPSPLFDAIPNYIRAHNDGGTFFDLHDNEHTN